MLFCLEQRAVNKLQYNCLQLRFSPVNVLLRQVGTALILDLCFVCFRHTREHYLDLVERIRSFLPDVSLSTDMISGFCGETEEDHRDTLSLIEIVKYHYAFLFKYSMRKVFGVINIRLFA